MNEMTIKEVTKIELLGIQGKRFALDIFFNLHDGDSVIEDSICEIYGTLTNDEGLILDYHDDYEFYWSNKIDMDPITDAIYKYLTKEVYTAA